MPFDLLEGLPALLAKRLRQRFKAAGAGRGIGDAPEIALFEQDELGVAGDAAREGIGQAERGGEGLDGDRIGAADPGREGRDGAAQQVDVRVALRQRAPRRFGMDADRLRRQAAGLLDAAPEQARGTELRHGQEFVGIRDQREGQRIARLGQVQALRLERTQIGDSRGERRAELLRLAGASLVIGPAVDLDEGAGEAALLQGADRCREPAAEFRPCGHERAAAGEDADRIEAERDGDLACRMAALFDQGGQQQGVDAALRGGVETQANEVQHHALERGIERRHVVGDKAVAACRQRPGEADGERVGAPLEIGESQRLRCVRLRMVEPGGDMPAPCLGA